MCAKFDQNRRGSRISLVDFISNDPVVIAMSETVAPSSLCLSGGIECLQMVL